MKKKSIFKNTLFSLTVAATVSASTLTGFTPGTFTITAHAATATAEDYSVYNKAKAQILSQTNEMLYTGAGDGATVAQNKELYQGIKKILASLNLTGNKYDDAVKIYNYVITHVTYDTKNESPYFAAYAYSAYKAGLAICSGFTSFFSALCNAAGITCWCVTGNNHAWNIVVIDGKQYLCDTTWGARGWNYCMIDPGSYENMSAKDLYIDHTDQNPTPVTKGFASAISNNIDAMIFSLEYMYRVYNPNSGEHFYTKSENELNHLVSVGWRDENIGWFAPDCWGDPVYRLYNPNAGDHHYTVSAAEKDSLVKAGWKYEGVGWKSGGTIPVYRQYNPNAKTGTHNYTTSKAERDMLVKAGWEDEGIAWYALDQLWSDKFE